MTANPAAVVQVPRATYRLQFNSGFRFVDAVAIVPYLARLGISHLYASPILKARPGSTHGYDVVDPGLLNPDIGSEDDFTALTDALRAHGLKLLLDIVPNHMGVLQADNPWWLDVLENGPAARHAAAFDIEWQPPQRELHGKLLLAVLGQPYGQALEAGELQPVFEPARGQFVVHYFDHRFPLDPADHAALLRLAPLPACASDADRALVDSLCEGFARLPPRDVTDAVARATRQRESAALKQALSAWQAETPSAAAWLDACAAQLRGTVGDASSFDALDDLLQRQAWRLAHWRAAGDELNYRRFFDINGLAGLRVEDEAVFEAAHRRVLAWVAEGRVAGLRIDHPDGMADPTAYFQRLQRRSAEQLGLAPADVPDGRAIYLLAEKILGEAEPWPREWPVHGDTGYRFANQGNGVFVDGEQAQAFDALYTGFVGGTVDFSAELDAAKRSIMSLSLAADLRLLTELAHDLALSHRHSRDLTRDGLQAAIVEFAAAHDVYRSYVSDRGAGPLDAARVEKCAAVARARVRTSLAPCVDFVRRLMLDEADPDTGPAGRRAARLRFVKRLQQFTAPVMAKSMEDTVFYRHHRLLSLNDVGGDPRQFGFDVAAFHTANALRLREMPHTLLGGSTHDSKRSVDVRARLNVLSEMPGRWSDVLFRLRDLSQVQLRMGGGTGFLAPNDEMLFFQTLVAVCPPALDDAGLASLRERLAAYLLKAVREAKQQSSWLDGNDAYEATVQHVVGSLLGRLEPNPFLSEVRRFVADIAAFGCCNSIGFTVLKLTSPGVPDFYQGNEDWAYSLVDPDNRRPVDFDALSRRLDGAERWARGGGEALPAVASGSLHKLYVVRQLLRWRTQAGPLFEHGDYRPLSTRGLHAGRVLAFARCHEGACSVTVVGRLLWQTGGGDIGGLLAGDSWGDTAVEMPRESDRTPAAAVAGSAAAAGWIDVISGRRFETVTHGSAPTSTEAAVGQDPEAPSEVSRTLPLSALLRGLPVAVLRPEGIGRPSPEPAGDR